jgi:hypothetical protein
LAKQRQPYEVRLIGVGEGGDTSFGEHTLASFPTHDPRKGKRIAWAWLKKEKRARRVAIAEISSENKIAYALEIERTNEQYAILLLARNDLQKIDPNEWQAFLLVCARRRGWALEDELAGYRRKTTTHRELVSIAVLESRIWRKITQMLKGAANP